MYRLLGELADGYAEDRVWLLREHFALTCQSENLARLGRIFGVPRWSFESDSDYRKRLVGAGFELESRGSISGFRWFMDALFGRGAWASNGEATATFAIGQSVVGTASIGGLSVLRVGIRAVGAFVVGRSFVGADVVGGRTNTASEMELRKFLDWFLAADIAYEIYYL